MSKILITGTTGFLGAHLTRDVLRTTSDDVYSIERLSTRRNILGDMAKSPRITHLYHDLRAPLQDWILKQIADTDYVIHVGAEVHGLRSVQDPTLFITNNVLSTFHMLEAARKMPNLKRFVYISSGEVVGSCAEGERATTATLRPSNPYAAAKGAGEFLARTYGLSFKVPTVIIRTMNMFGPGQDTSKFLPATIGRVLRGDNLICHVGPDGMSGSRQWIYVQDFIDAMRDVVREEPIPASVYHIVGPEFSNHRIIKLVCLVLGRNPLIAFQQPGKTHDMRYSLINSVDDDRFTGTEDRMIETIQWYEGNREWL